jgi:hypothetical protein
LIAILKLKHEILDLCPYLLDDLQGRLPAPLRQALSLLKIFPFDAEKNQFGGQLIQDARQFNGFRDTQRVRREPEKISGKAFFNGIQPTNGTGCSSGLDGVKNKNDSGPFP